MTSNTSDIAPSMRAARTQWGISMPILKAAKAAGCPAFRSSRVHRVELLRWIRANPGPVSKAQAVATEKTATDELKRQKLVVEISILKEKVRRNESDFIAINLTREVWQECEAICFECAVDLLDPDFLRVMRERCASRLATPLARLHPPADLCLTSNQTTV